MSLFYFRAGKESDGPHRVVRPSGSGKARVPLQHPCFRGQTLFSGGFAVASGDSNLFSLAFRATKKKTHLSMSLFYFRAGKEIRTLDPNLGKVMLYQLSYSRDREPIIETTK